MKNNMPQLSVLIPTYNREKWVKYAIESVINQPFQNWEMICSDNASTDNTFKILQSFAKKDKRIKIFRNSENIGPVLNWKNCLENSCGEFIHWLWSDDWVEKNFYVDAFNLINNYQTNVISCWNYRVEQNYIHDRYISWRFSKPCVPGYLAAKKILTMTKELPLSPAAYIIKRSLINKHFYINIPAYKKFDPVKNGVGVDALMIAGACLDSEKIYIIQKPSVNFRKHDNISVLLHKDHSLGKMYFISFLWFLENNLVQLNILDIIKIVTNIIRVYKFQIIKMLIKNKSIIKSLKSLHLFSVIDKYKSQKAVIR